MTNDAIQRLTTIASGPLSEGTPRMPSELAKIASPLESQLLRLYWAKNGFYAFESALHVFPVTPETDVMDVGRWNDPGLWRSAFGVLADGAVFFAEDIFGTQFCVSSGAVQRFNPETGDRERLTDSIEGWAEMILDDPTFQTGWSLAHEWQERFGPLLKNQRLVPKMPFILGGDFSVSNLQAIDSVSGMMFYADIARQIHELPDGTEFRIRIVD